MSAAGGAVVSLAAAAPPGLAVRRLSLIRDRGFLRWAPRSLAIELPAQDPGVNYYT
jgi:hypothetical protein